MDFTNSLIAALAVSALLLLSGAALCISLYKKHRSHGEGFRNSILTPFQIYVIFIFFAVAAIHYPVVYKTFGEAGFWSLFKSFFVAIRNTLQVFTIDAAFFELQEVVNEFAQGPTVQVYSVYASVLYVLAPAITASFILSLFKDTSALLAYALYPASDIYLFSDLNEKALTLAKDITDKKKGRKLIVFAGVDSGDVVDELAESAKMLGALCVKREITRVSLKPRRKNIRRSIYLISDDFEQNLSYALGMLDKCNRGHVNNPKTEMYVFAGSGESNALLSNLAENTQIKIRLVNEERNMAWTTLNNVSVFSNAIETGGIKRLNIAVVGGGNYGRELVKALCWLCQMPGYSLTVHVFDGNPAMESRFKADCPELWARRGVYEDGEAQYSLFFHTADVRCAEFFKELKEAGEFTSVFVTLGSDDLNLGTAMAIRTAFLQNNPERGIRPQIYPVVFSALRNAATQKIKNTQDSVSLDYKLHIIGKIDDCFSVENVERRKLEEIALRFHKIWATRGDAAEAEKYERQFDASDYFRSSSIAQAIYMMYLLRRLPDIKELMKDEGNVEMFNEYEHRRWNAYMRAEGYVYNPKRDNLAKTHKNLVPFGLLDQKTREKDTVWRAANEIIDEIEQQGLY